MGVFVGLTRWEMASEDDVEKAAPAERIENELQTTGATMALRRVETPPSVYRVQKGENAQACAWLLQGLRLYAFPKGLA
jgi:hypothetical protein